MNEESKSNQAVVKEVEKHSTPKREAKLQISTTYDIPPGCVTPYSDCFQPTKSSPPPPNTSTTTTNEWKCIHCSGYRPLQDNFCSKCGKERLILFRHFLPVGNQTVFVEKQKFFLMEAEARRLLMGTIRDDGDAVQKEFQAEAVLKILKSYPRLATIRLAKEFRHPWALLYFIEARAELETIRRLVELNFEHYYVLSVARELKAVITACVYGSKKGVVEYLLEQFPRELETKGTLGRSALQVLLSQNYPPDSRPVHLVKLFLEKKPTMLVARTTLQSDLIYPALNGDYGEAIRTIIFEHLAKSYRENQTMPYFSLLRYNGTLGVQQVTAMNTILPYLTKLDINNSAAPAWRPRTWTRDSLLLFLRKLSENRSIERLSLCIPSAYFAPGDDSTSSLTMALEMALSQNPALKSISCYPASGALGDAFFQAVANAIRINKSIVKVRLDKFSLSSAGPLSKLLSDSSSMRSMLLEDFTIEGKWVPCEFQETCQIEEIDIRSSFLSSDSMMGLVSQLHELPSLRRLKLQNSTRLKDADMTFILVDLLEKGALTHLNIACLRVDDWKAFQEALRQNRTIQRLIILPRDNWAIHPSKTMMITDAVLEALENGNTTLQYVLLMLSPYSKKLFRIDYLAGINRAGRAQAIKHPPLHEFVDLLCNVSTSANNEAWPSSKHNTIHGLLRCYPSLWAS